MKIVDVIVTQPNYAKGLYRVAIVKEDGDISEHFVQQKVIDSISYLVEKLQKNKPKKLTCQKLK